MHALSAGLLRPDAVTQVFQTPESALTVFRSQHLSQSGKQCFAHLSCLGIHQKGAGGACTPEYSSVLTVKVVILFKQSKKIIHCLTNKMISSLPQTRECLSGRLTRTALDDGYSYNSTFTYPGRSLVVQRQVLLHHLLPGMVAVNLFYSRSLHGTQARGIFVH